MYQGFLGVDAVSASTPTILPLPNSVSPGPPRSRSPTPFHRKPDDLAAASLASLAALGLSRGYHFSGSAKMIPSRGLAYFGRHPGPPPGQQGKLGWGVRLHCSPPRPGIGPL
jgi:hypothetical protein